MIEWLINFLFKRKEVEVEVELEDPEICKSCSSVQADEDIKNYIYSVINNSKGLVLIKIRSKTDIYFNA